MSFLEELKRRKVLKTLGVYGAAALVIINIVTSALEFAIQSIDGVSDKNKIKYFINNMPAFDSRSLRNHIKENEPGLDMQHSFKCTNCSHTNEANLPLTSEFFWPST